MISINAKLLSIAHYYRVHIRQMYRVFVNSVTVLSQVRTPYSNMNQADISMWKQT